MDTLDIKHLPVLLRITYGVLAARSIVLLAVVMTFSLFCWAMATGSWQSLATACAFALLVFWPIMNRGMKKEAEDGQDS